MGLNAEQTDWNEVDRGLSACGDR